MCLNSFFVGNTDAQVNNEADSNYTFETIDVPGVEFLELTASSDFEGYAGNTRSPDGEKRSALHSLMAFSLPTISLHHITPFSMHSVMMGGLPDTMRIGTVCTTVSSWKMGNCGNMISRAPSKRRYTYQ